MKRLAEINLNTPDDYGRIFFERQVKNVDWADLRRWEMLLKYYKGGNLIDLGCLDSLIPSIAKEQYPDSEIWGLDFAKDVILEMKNQYPLINYFQGDIYDIRWVSSQNRIKDGFYSYVTMGEIIEHLEEPEKAIKEAMRILKQNEILALSTPLNEAIEPGAVDKEHHLWSFTEDDIKKMLKPYGRVKIKILRSWWFPRYRYCFPQIIAWCWKI